MKARFHKPLEHGKTDALSLSLVSLAEKTSEHVIRVVLRSGAAAARASWRRPSRTRVKLVSWRHGPPGEITKPAGRRSRLRQQAAQRSGGRAAGRPRRATGVSHTVGGVTTLCTARAGARARVHEHAASGATERGRRCSERSSLRAPAPPPSAPPRTARAFSRTHQNDEFIFRACWPSYLRTLPRVSSQHEINLESYYIRVVARELWKYVVKLSHSTSVSNERQFVWFFIY